MTGAREKYCSAGFTLVEVLIALTLTAVMSGLLISALHTFALGSTAGQNHIEAEQRDESVRHFVTQQLSAAVPLSLGRTRNREMLFSGNGDSIAFVANVPSHRAPGGLHRNLLFVEGEAADKKLRYAYARLIVDEAFDSETFESLDEGMEVRTLVDHAEAIDFEYLGTLESDEDQEWRDEWTDASNLPELIRIRITKKDTEPADEMIIRIHAYQPGAQLALAIDEGAVENPSGAPEPGANDVVAEPPPRVLR